MRRPVLLALAAALLVAAGCGTDQGGAGAAPSASGPVLTNSAGRTTTLPSMPRRIVMDAPTAAALWGYGVRPVALLGALTDDPVTLGDVDPAGIDVVAGGFDVDLERLTALRPDLVVARPYICGETFGQGPEESGAVAPFAATINERIAPCVAISDDRGVLAQFEAYENLARALGGTVDSPQLDADRQAFRATSDQVRDLVRRKPDVDVVAYSTSGTRLFALSALPPGRQQAADEDPGFRYLADVLGMRVTGPAAAANSFVQVSPEQLVAQRADVVFTNTNRRTGAGPSQFATWAAMPAVAAGQTATFNDYRPTTYRAWTQWMREQVIPALERARNLG